MEEETELTTLNQPDQNDQSTLATTSNNNSNNDNNNNNNAGNSSSNSSSKSNSNSNSSSHSNPNASALNSKYKKDLKLLFKACQVGDLKTVQNLLEFNPKYVNSYLSDNISALHWASINNRLSIVKFLISKGAIVDHKGGDLNATPLHWACKYGLVYIVHYLILNGASPLKKDAEGFNALHLAVHSSNIMLVIYIIIMTGIPIDELDSNSRTALHWACYQGDSLSVDFLLNFNANINLPDNTGFAPLHWALLKGNRSILKNLINNNADLSLKTIENKDPFIVAKEMNTIKNFKTALIECDRNPSSGSLNKRFLNTSLKHKKIAKISTFFIPYLAMGLILYFLSELNYNKDSFDQFGTYYYYSPLLIIFLLILALSLITIFTRSLISNYLNEKNSLIKSPFLSGVFSSTSFYVICSWFFYVLPTTSSAYPLTNLFLFLFISAMVFAFFNSMFLNPGLIPKPKSIQKNITDLLDIGKFDSKNFCIRTYIRKPLRSKYSMISKNVVARYDHYCPWVYNDIGLTNHKSFLFFILSLELDIWLYVFLLLNHFKSIYFLHYNSNNDTYDLPYSQCKILSDKLCYGYNYSFSSFVLLCFVCFQGTWIFFLVLTQFWQISMNLTTNEANELQKDHQYASAPNSNYHYSSVPPDFSSDSNDIVNSTENDLTSTLSNQSTSANSISTNSHHIKRYSKQITCCSSFKKVTGIDQFCLFLNKNRLNFLKKNKFNNGFKINCLDFWLNDDNLDNGIKSLFKTPPQNGYGRFNGEIINYYEFYDSHIASMTYRQLV
ncbi:ankyrin repeat domain-containing DHHC palmitoyltransferase family protein [Ascoidea rubescens DSM 1968]|uniref:Palmitoyltransferase n=1 Tax=Ascoidea rubescens DSM 1968 TaxID=1344418 RepID=A0A1D2VQK4_9ASCO|nr:ankyrin [Ascoidea rubescens DSM 1968]ODV63847.1 ankyrin [Ascoidea rubescens DSM 1968]